MVRLSCGWESELWDPESGPPGHDHLLGLEGGLELAFRVPQQPELVVALACQGGRRPVPSANSLQWAWAKKENQKKNQGAVNDR